MEGRKDHKRGQTEAEMGQHDQAETEITKKGPANPTHHVQLLCLCHDFLCVRPALVDTAAFRSEHAGGKRNAQGQLRPRAT